MKLLMSLFHSWSYLHVVLAVLLLFLLTVYCRITPSAWLLTQRLFCVCPLLNRIRNSSGKANQMSPLADRPQLNSVKLNLTLNTLQLFAHTPPPHLWFPTLLFSLFTDILFLLSLRAIFSIFFSTCFLSLLDKV